MKHISLVFSDPILFCLFLFLYTSFHVFYFLSFSSVCLCIYSTFSFSFCLFLCLSSTFFLAALYLSPLIFFVYHLLSLSASVSFFVLYFPSWCSSTFFLCLSSIISPLLFSLSFHICLFYY